MNSQSATEPDKEKVSTDQRTFGWQELAEILGLSKSGFFKRADDEGWPFQEVAVRGGRQKLFPLHTLPIDVQRKVRIHLGELPAEIAEGIPDGWDADKAARCARAWGAAEEWQKQWATDRSEILKALEKYREEKIYRRERRVRGAEEEVCAHARAHKHSAAASAVPSAVKYSGKRAATDEFARLYNRREAPAIDPELYNRVKKISRSQLYEWERKYENEGIAGLLSQNGQWKKGGTILPLDQRKFLLGLMASKPDLTPVQLHGLLQAQFNGSVACENTVRAFIKREIERDPRTWCFLRNPDEYKSKYQLALGNRSELATHFLHYVEVDSTPGDVKCSDGKRYNLCGLIDLFSRKARYVLSPTSNSLAIAGLLWSVFKDWGIPENLIRDRGQDYASEHISEALAGVEVGVKVLTAFTPEDKPHIERMMKTLLHGLYPLLSGYLGHNVAERKAIENRKSFAERMRKGGTVEIGLSPSELQEIINAWIENRYHQREHGTLGMSPNAKQASVPHRPRRIDDPAVLALALAPREERKVLKDGIRFENGWYWDDPATGEADPDSLVNWIGQKIIVVVDMNDAGRLFCFSRTDKQFICQARDMALSGITIGEKIAARKRANKTVRKQANAMKTIAKGFGDPLAEELERIRTERPALTNLPVGDPITGNPFLNSCFQAAEAARTGEEKREEGSRGTRFLQEAGSPDPSGKNSHIFPEPAPGLGARISTFPNDPDGSLEIANRRMVQEGPEWRINQTGTNKVVKLITRDKEQIERLYFANPREKFEYLRRKQRTQELTEEEIRWLQTFVDDWFDVADMFVDQWSEEDQVWVGKIAPDHFPQYVTEEVK